MPPASPDLLHAMHKAFLGHPMTNRDRHACDMGEELAADVTHLVPRTPPPECGHG